MRKVTEGNQERTIDVPANIVSADPGGSGKRLGSAATRRWWALAAVSLATLMGYLDSYMTE